jgi:hypothetical protein
VLVSTDMAPLMQHLIPQSSKLVLCVLSTSVFVIRTRAHCAAHRCPAILMHIAYV